jgi:hypothetical protein
MLTQEDHHLTTVEQGHPLREVVVVPHLQEVLDLKVQEVANLLEEVINIIFLNKNLKI